MSESKIVYIPSYVESGLTQLKSAKLKLQSIAAYVDAGVAMIQATDLDYGVPTFDKGEAAADESMSLETTINYIISQIETYSSGDYVFSDDDLVIMDPNDTETLTRLGLTAEDVMSIDAFEAQRFTASIEYLGATFVESLVTTAGSLIDGFASILSIPAWGGLEKSLQEFVDQDVTSDFVKSLYSDETLKMSYTNTSGGWKLLETGASIAGSAVPYIVAGAATSPLLASTGLSGGWLKLADFALDTAIGSTGALGMGVDNALNQGLTFDQAMAVGWEEGKKDAVMNTVFTVGGNIIGKGVNSVINRGINSALDEASQVAARNAIEEMNDGVIRSNAANISGVTSLDDGVEALARRQGTDAYNALVDNVKTTAVDDFKVSHAAEIDSYKARGLSDDDAYKQVVQDYQTSKIKADVEARYESAANSKFDTELNAAKLDAKVEASRMNDVDLKDNVTKLVTDDVNARVKSGELSNADAVLEINKRTSGSSNDLVNEYVNQKARLYEKNRASSVQQYLDTSRTRIDTDIANATPSSTTRLFEDGEARIVKDAVETKAPSSLLQEKINIERTNLLGTNSGVSASKVKSQLSEGLNKELSDTTAAKVAKHFGGDETLGTATTAARRAMEDALNSGGTYTVRELQQIGQKAASDSIKGISLGSGSAQAKNLFKQTDAKYADDLAAVKRNKKPSTYSPDGTVKNNTNPVKKAASGTGSQNPKPKSTPDTSNAKPKSTPDTPKVKTKAETSSPKVEYEAKPKVQKKATSLGEVVEESGKDTAGRAVKKTTNPDGSIDIKKTSTETINGNEVKVEVNEKFGVAEELKLRETLTTDNNGNILKREVEGPGGKVIEERTLSADNPKNYTAKVTDTKGNVTTKKVTVDAKGKTTTEYFDSADDATKKIKKVKEEYKTIENGIEKSTTEIKYREPDGTTSGVSKRTEYTTKGPDGEDYKVIERTLKDETSVLKETNLKDGSSTTYIDTKDGGQGLIEETYDQATKTRHIETTTLDGRTIEVDKTPTTSTRKIYDADDNFVEARRTTIDPETKTRTIETLDENGKTLSRETRPLSELSTSVDADDIAEEILEEAEEEAIRAIENSRNKGWYYNNAKTDGLGQSGIARWEAHKYRQQELGTLKDVIKGERSILDVLNHKKTYANLGRESFLNQKAIANGYESIDDLRRAVDNGTDKELLERITKEVDDMKPRALRKEGKKYLKEHSKDVGWSKVDELLESGEAGQKQINKAGHISRAARVAIGVAGYNLLKGDEVTPPDPTETPSTTAPSTPTTDPYRGSSPSNDDDDGGGNYTTPESTDTLTDTNVDPLETTDTLTPDEVTENLEDEVIEEIVNGVTDTIPTEDNPNNGGGGQNWGSYGDGESFDEVVEEELTDEDALLGDEDLEGLEDEDSIYTIPLATEGSSTTSKVTKDGVNAIPILAGLGLVAAAGVGAKIYMDNKKNNENGDDDEFMDDSEFEEFSSTDSDLIADEWTGEETPDNKEESLDYEKPSFYSDTLGDEI